MQDFDIREVLTAGNYEENGSTVQVDGQTAFVFEENMIFVFKHVGELLVLEGQKKLTTKPNYKLLSEINNSTPIGKHLISNERDYSFNILLRLTGVDGIRQELPIYVEYIKRQATQGYTILNTTSDVKRKAVLRAHMENRDM